jgi:class 3 adenylate cyclase
MASQDEAPMGRLRTLVERSEALVLVLAAVSVGIYLGALTGFWEDIGLKPVAIAVGATLDLVFVIDLVLKVAVLGRPYLRTGWFVIDLVSALPVLNTLSVARDALRGLRFLRGLRVFRLLRSLRSLRMVRSMPGLRPPPSSEESPESAAFHRALAGSVIVYVVVLLAIVDNPFGDPRTAELYLVVGSLLGIALVLAVVRWQLPDVSAQQVRTLLNVALPQQVAGRLMRDPSAYGHSVRGPATVIFCDLSGFTASVEALGGDLDALKHNLESCLDAVVAVHLRHDLIVDKFIGDAVMSFRGGDMVEGDPADHARRVVKAAVESAAALASVQNPWFKTMKIGGASASDILIGTFGTSRRLSYTVLGDRVNLASRLEGQCGKFGVGNLFDATTRELAEACPGVVWRRIGRIRVQGKQEPITVHEALDAAHDTSWVAAYEDAVARYEARDFEAARAGFEAVLAARGGDDGPSKVFAEEAARLARDGAPDGWEPVLQTKK